jgi:hypothetical protein
MNKNWKAEITEVAPNCAYILDDPDIDGIESFWLEVYFEFTRDEQETLKQKSKVEEIFRLSHKHLYSQDLNYRSAVVLNFFEDLITHKWVQDYLHNWISFDDFKEMDTVFKRQLSPEDFSKISNSFR